MGSLSREAFSFMASIFAAVFFPGKSLTSGRDRVLDDDGILAHPEEPRQTSKRDRLPETKPFDSAKAL